MAQNAVQVEGLRNINRALARADKQVRADARKIMAGVAQPVASHAESLARGNIRNIGERWPVMRIGVTQKAIYVVPKQRGRFGKKNTRLKRPNLARLLATRAMDPAREKYGPFFKHEMERAMDKMARRFNNG